MGAGQRGPGWRAVGLTLDPARSQPPGQSPPGAPSPRWAWAQAVSVALGWVLANISCTQAAQSGRKSPGTGRQAPAGPGEASLLLQGPIPARDLPPLCLWGTPDPFPARDQGPGPARPQGSLPHAQLWAHSPRPGNTAPGLLQGQGSGWGPGLGGQGLLPRSYPPPSPALTTAPHCPAPGSQTPPRLQHRPRPQRNLTPPLLPPYVAPPPPQAAPPCGHWSSLQVLHPQQ